MRFAIADRFRGVRLAHCKAVAAGTSQRAGDRPERARGLSNFGGGSLGEPPDGAFPTSSAPTRPLASFADVAGGCAVLFDVAPEARDAADAALRLEVAGPADPLRTAARAGSGIAAGPTVDAAVGHVGSRRRAIVARAVAALEHVAAAGRACGRARVAGARGLARARTAAGRTTVAGATGRARPRARGGARRSGERPMRAPAIERVVVEEQVGPPAAASKTCEREQERPAQAAPERRARWRRLPGTRRRRHR